MIRIALDAMGGDTAPEAEVDGAAQALAELPPTFMVQLVGRTADIERSLTRHAQLPRKRLQIIEAPEV
ncbi:MAG: phosphate acyltransferase, partial [Gemmatimonadota bacterium]